MASTTAIIKIPMWKTAEWIANRLELMVAERRADAGGELTEYQRGVLDGLDVAVKSMRAMHDEAGT